MQQTRTLLSRTHTVLWLPALLAALLYLPALHGGFVWDDTLFLVDMPFYRDPANWAAALTRPFLISPNYYRPLALLTFLIELRLFGLAPWAFHLTNLVLHAFNPLLVTRLALVGVIALGPVLNILPLELGGGAFVAERFLTFPLSLLALAVAVTLATPVAPRAVSLRNGALALWLVAAVATVQMTVPHWCSDEALWRWAMRREPQGALNALGQAEQLGAAPEDVAIGRSAALIALGELDAAESLLREMLAAGVENARAYNNLGLIARQRGENDTEREYFQRAIELAPEWELPRQNLEAMEE